MLRLTVPLCAALACNLCFAQTDAASLPTTAAAVASTAHPLTLRDALDLAWRSNPELSAAQREQDAVEAARMQAGVLPNPTLGFELEDTRRETRTTTLMLSQPIELGGKRDARMQAADHAVAIARSQLAARGDQVRSSVTSAFFETLIAQDRLRLAEESLRLAEGASQAAGKRVTAGKVAPLDETKARVAESSARLELTRARSELQARGGALRVAIGVPNVDVSRLDGRVNDAPSVPTPADLERRLASAPAAHQAWLEIERQGALAAVERAKRMPDVTLSVGAKHSEELGRNQAVIGVSVPLPLFDTNRGNVLEAMRRQDKARDEARAITQRLQVDAMVARQRLATAADELAVLLRDVLPTAQSAYDAAVKGFELGKFSFLDILDAQRTLFATRAQYLQALSEAHQAAAELDRLLGDPDAPALPLHTPNLP